MYFSLNRPMPLLREFFVPCLLRQAVSSGQCVVCSTAFLLHLRPRSSPFFFDFNSGRFTIGSENSILIDRIHCDTQVQPI